MTTDATDDIVAIGRLQSAYADVVNRRAWGELDGLFMADAHIRIDTVTRPTIELVGAEALGDFIGSAVERFAFFEFVPLNAHTELGAESGPGATPMPPARDGSCARSGATSTTSTGRSRTACTTTATAARRRGGGSSSATTGP